MTAIERRDPKLQTGLKEYALFAPRLGRLLWRLMRDPRVPARSKALLFMIAGYLASPIDVLPDMIPGLGQVDDAQRHQGQARLHHAASSVTPASS
jgi:uncharacterized membrane protein YkvA (DUF1232 family)